MLPEQLCSNAKTLVQTAAWVLAVECCEACLATMTRVAAIALQVEVLWVFNQQQTAWEQLLPQETANALAQARRSEQQSSRGISGVIKKVENAADFALSQRRCLGL